MGTFRLDEILNALGLLPAGGRNAPTGGMSGASVVRATTEAGEPVVVKMARLDTALSRDQTARELTVYTELADRFRLPTPRLVASHRTSSWQAIAVEAHEPAPPAPHWTDADWRQFARLLGRLHIAVRHTPEPLRHRRPERTVPDEQLPAFTRRLWNGPGDGERVRKMLADLGQLEEEASTGPVAFVHGDCHLGNVLQDDDGRLLLVDWQSSGTGPSDGDLAFALTRAIPTGADIPRDEVIAAYRQEAGADLNRTQRRITAHQILILLTQYPEFAEFLGDLEVRRLRAQLDLLLEQWASGR